MLAATLSSTDTRWQDRRAHPSPGQGCELLVTETSQGGAIPHLTVCAGASAQTIPSGSIVTWSLIAP